MRFHARAGVLSHIGNERACKTSALLARAAPEETASAVFQCVAGKKSRSDREKDDACIKLLFNGCRRLAVGYR